MVKTVKSDSQDKAGGVGGVVVELSVAIVALADESPKTLLVRPPDAISTPGLPCGPFNPLQHRTLEEGLRTWVDEQTGLHMGYVEQLYTFGDRDRDRNPGRGGGPRQVSVGYLALVRQTAVKNPAEATWNDWYRYFPWEDWRDGPPVLLDSFITPKLEAWCAAAGSKSDKQRRRERADLAFGHGGGSWDNERVLDRYELLFEVGLIAEAGVEGRGSQAMAADAPARAGAPLTKDHRRILATAMGRLRGKIKYRPIIFELMPPTFTLFQLQRAVEALSGGRLHKQNFRRLVAHEGLVEPTGRVSSQTVGRPAELFRFRREVVHERRAPGVRVPLKVIKKSG